MSEIKVLGSILIFLFAMLWVLIPLEIYWVWNSEEVNIFLKICTTFIGVLTLGLVSYVGSYVIEAMQTW